MEVVFLPEADKDLDFWVKTGNKVVLKKITSLIADILEHPYEGIGKPHALKHELSGSWSRRITDEHRLVYAIKDELILEIQSAKGHYFNR